MGKTHLDECLEDEVPNVSRELRDVDDGLSREPGALASRSRLVVAVFFDLGLGFGLSARLAGIDGHGFAGRGLIHGLVLKLAVVDLFASPAAGASRRRHCEACMCRDGVLGCRGDVLV
jgi:hypothetical protein